MDKVGSFRLAGGIEHLARLLQGDRRCRRRRRCRRTRRTRRRCATRSRARRSGTWRRERARPQAAGLGSDPAATSRPAKRPPSPKSPSTSGTRRARSSPMRSRPMTRPRTARSSERLPDGVVTTLHSGKGRYRSVVFDEAGQQIAFLSDQAEFEKPVAPVSPLLLEEPETEGVRARVGNDAGDAEGHGRCRKRRAAVLARRRTALPRHLSPAGAAPDPNATTPEPIAVDLWSTKDPWHSADAARPRR